jgi:hypothetical protein
VRPPPPPLQFYINVISFPVSPYQHLSIYGQTDTDLLEVFYLFHLPKENQKYESFFRNDACVRRSLLLNGASRRFVLVVTVLCVQTPLTTLWRTAPAHAPSFWLGLVKPSTFTETHEDADRTQIVRLHLDSLKTDILLNNVLNIHFLRKRKHYAFP